MTDRDLGDDSVFLGDDGIYRRREEMEAERLTNVTIAVVTNVVWHERLGIRHTLELDVALDGEVRRISISPDDLARLRFVDALFGARAIVGPARDARRAIAHALRVKAAAAPMRYVYTVLGWQKGLFVGGGGVTPPDLSIARVIAVPPALHAYGLAAPAAPGEARVALGALLAFVASAPTSVVVSVLLALVAPVLAAGGGVHLVGDRGDCAALAALVGQCQGASAADAVLDRPDSPTALDALLGAAPYHALAIDCPESEDMADVRHAEQLIAGLHTPAPGRAAVVTFGGPPPRRAAGRAALTLAVPHGTATSCAELQQLIDDGAIARLRAAILAELARRGGVDTERLATSATAARRLIAKRAPGIAVPETAAAILGAVHLWLDAVTDADMVTVEDGARWRETALVTLAGVVTARAGDALPAPDQVVFGLLRDALFAKRCHLSFAAPTPPAPGEVGWRCDQAGVWHPQGVRVGWIDAGDLYLDKERLLKILLVQARASGTICPVTSERQLGALLRDHGALVQRGGRSEMLARRLVYRGENLRAFHLALARILPAVAALVLAALDSEAPFGVPDTLPNIRVGRPAAENQADVGSVGSVGTDERDDPARSERSRVRRPPLLPGKPRLIVDQPETPSDPDGQRS